MAATTAALFATASAVGLYGAQAEQAKQLSKDLEGASPLVKSTIDNLTNENIALKAAKESLEKDKSTLAKEKSEALAKLVAAERARQSITQKLIANSPAEEAFRTANPQVIKKAADKIVAATSATGPVAEVLRSPASGLFRRGTLQQLYQRVLQAEGMSEPEAAAAAAAAPVPSQPETEDGGRPDPVVEDGEVPDPVITKPEDEDSAETSNPGSGATSRRVSTTSMPASVTSAPPEVAPTTPATQALRQAVNDAEEALDEAKATARRNAIPGANIDQQEEVVRAREAVRLAEEALDKALYPSMKGGAKVAGTYDDFAKLWLDAITQTLAGVQGEKETKAEEKDRNKRDTIAARAASGFQRTLTSTLDRVNRDRVSKDAVVLTPEQSTAVAPKKQALDDLVARGVAAADEASRITTDEAWTAFRANLTLKDEIAAAYTEYANAVNAAVPKQPLSQRLGIALPKFTFAAPAPAAPPTVAPRGASPRPSSVLSSFSAPAPAPAPPSPVLAPAPPPVIAPAPAPPAVDPVAAAKEAAERASSLFFVEQARVEDMKKRGLTFDSPGVKAAMQRYKMAERAADAADATLQRVMLAQGFEKQRRSSSIDEQQAALDQEPLAKPAPVPRKRLGGSRKSTLKKRRGLNKRNVRRSRRS
jgi:hypothetical protein